MKTARVAYRSAIHSAAPHPAGLQLTDGRVLAEQDVVWLPPFEGGTIIALGLNDADPVAALRKDLTVTAQDEPLVVPKGPGSLIGHRGETRRPAGRRGLHALRLRTGGGDRQDRQECRGRRCDGPCGRLHGVHGLRHPRLPGELISAQSAGQEPQRWHRAGALVGGRRRGARSACAGPAHL